MAYKYFPQEPPVLYRNLFATIPSGGRYVFANGTSLGDQWPSRVDFQGATYEYDRNTGEIFVYNGILAPEVVDPPRPPEADPVIFALQKRLEKLDFKLAQESNLGNDRYRRRAIERERVEVIAAINRERDQLNQSQDFISRRQSLKKITASRLAYVSEIAEYPVDENGKIAGIEPMPLSPPRWDWPNEVDQIQMSPSNPFRFPEETQMVTMDELKSDYPRLRQSPIWGLQLKDSEEGVPPKLAQRGINEKELLRLEVEKLNYLQQQAADSAQAYRQQKLVRMSQVSDATVRLFVCARCSGVVAEYWNVASKLCIVCCSAEAENAKAVPREQREQLVILVYPDGSEKRMQLSRGVAVPVVTREHSVLSKGRKIRKA